ncbi:chaoptin [Bacillus rossius redtenbacheri]|uniref:chaoptin n=1 Tax=Bacillus rossius redtenbacheri TaxID=93214 RepID=UPI002FDC83C5
MDVSALWLLAAVQLVAGEYIPPGPRYRCPDKPLLLYPCKCIRSGDEGIGVLCENTNLASVSVGLANLASLKLPIHDLTFYKCNMGKLYGSLLYQLRARVLRIEDTPITSIAPHTFHGINRTLQELHILRSQLQEFPSEAFQILGNVTWLRLEGHRLRAMPRNAFGGGSLPGRLERLSLVGGSLSELPPEALAPLRRLKVLDLHANNLTQLRKNQFKGLRDAEVVDLSFNNLSKIDASHFADLNKMSWCNLSHNAIADLPRGTFARNTVLRVLNLSGNKLRKLDANTFRGMRFIRRLYFSDNSIANVGRGTFGAVTRIGTIDLARNRLRTIDYQMFHQLNFVEVIDVSGNEVTEVQKLAFKDLFLVSINISHNLISKIEPGAFENCANITVLDLSHNKLQALPRTAFDSSTYATELLLSHNQFTDLSQVPLHNMTGLKILNASHNAIETIPRNTFPKLYELHTIDLSHNRLREVWNGVFQTLFSLRSLNMSHNSLQAVKGSTFGALHTLLELDLSHNNISDMNKVALARLSSLRMLQLQRNALSRVFQLPISLSSLFLSHNSLQRIEPLTTWPVMNSLLLLDLGYNRLGDSLQRGSFANLLTLQTLDLAGNGLSAPPWESLADMSTLQYLYLQENNLTFLSKGAFGRLPVVFELNLANNNINNISTRAFEGLLQLLTLNLTGNNLFSIPNGAFQGLVSLRTLDLSYNKLEKLDNKTNSLLEDCLSLENVNLSHNRISFVTRKTFPSSPWIPYRLRQVDLSHNTMPVLTFDLTVGTAKLEVLNVSYNAINEIRRYVLGNMTALRVLDMSHNQLQDLPDWALGPPRNLSELRLAHNSLSRLPSEALLSLRGRLSLLDASHNLLRRFQHELMPLAQNSTVVCLRGNPLECSCTVRPLKQWLSAQTSPSDTYANLTCSAPDFLAGRLLAEVSEDRMTCPDKDPASSDAQLAVNPDIKFRDISRSAGGEISATWFVTTRDDVGAFHLLVRDTASRGAPPVYEQDLPYSARSHVVPRLSAVQAGAPLELCVLAQDSTGASRRWRAGQCRSLGEAVSTAAQTLPGCALLCALALLGSWSTC